MVEKVWLLWSQMLGGVGGVLGVCEVGDMSHFVC